MRSSLLAVTAVLATLVVGGCSTDAVAPQSTPQPSRTVSSQFGQVVLPGSPQQALGMYTTDVDILITLGFPLAKEQPIRGDGYTTFPTFFPQAELKGVKPFANYPDYNYEKILAAKPDFILNGLGYDTKTVTRLKEIAPTYSVDAFDGKSWLVHFKDTADALGRTKEYDAWMAKYQKRIAEVKASIGAKATDTVVAPVSYWDGKVSSSCYSGVECQAFDDLGLTVYPGAKAKGGEGVALSSEQVGQLSDIDLAFAIKGPGDKGQKEFDAILKTLAKNKLWSALPFVENDHYATYDMEMTYGSPSGQMAFLDVVEQAFKDV